MNLSLPNLNLHTTGSSSSAYISLKGEHWHKPNIRGGNVAGIRSHSTDQLVHSTVLPY